MRLTTWQSSGREQSGSPSGACSTSGATDGCPALTTRAPTRGFGAVETRCAPCLDGACATHWNDLTITDNGAYAFCTRTQSPFVCVELKITEIPPN